MTLRLRITPTDGAVEVVFRGSLYRGADFHRTLRRTRKSERITIRAKGYEPQHVYVVLSESQELPIVLKKVSGKIISPPRRRPQRQRWRKRNQDDFRSLPD